MFRSLHWRLLTYQLLVMASIIGVFGAGVYAFVSRNLYQQLDKKLITLAQAATPSFSSVAAQGEGYLEQVDEVPWRDIFNRDRQSLEWFDDEGNQLGRRGKLEMLSKPRLGVQTVPQRRNAEAIRSVTISVFQDGLNTNEEPVLRGYIRASQSAQDVQTAQQQLLLGLFAGGAIALGLTGLGGLWLTRKSVQPIEQSFRQLRQFTADASHELRSPLTAIQTSIDVILNHPERIHPKDAKKLAAIASATTQMHRLAEDLLLLARMDAPLALSAHEERQPLSLSDLLQELVELIEPSAEQKDIQLQCKPLPPIVILGDRNQLGRLFSNLLHNAVQYTPAGGRVSVTLTKQARYAVVSVEDTGIGIPEEQLPLIFDRFWRADKARSRREGGTGLGLAIAKAITQRHHGKIGVTSTLDQGTCFTVKLPLMTTGGLMISSGS